MYLFLKMMATFSSHPMFVLHIVSSLTTKKKIDLKMTCTLCHCVAEVTFNNAVRKTEKIAKIWICYLSFICKTSVVSLT